MRTLEIMLINVAFKWRVFQLNVQLHVYKIISEIIISVNILVTAHVPYTTVCVIPVTPDVNESNTTIETDYFLCLIKPVTLY